jgi:hypothetical protein
MLTLSLRAPAGADSAVQQYGRSHRSNQASAPIYRLLVTNVGGERRFAASAAKRLQSLGALLKGDRRALGAGATLREFDIENAHGSAALKRVYQDMMGISTPMVGVKLPGNDLARFQGLVRPALVSVGLATWNTSVSRYSAWGAPAGGGAAGMAIEIKESQITKVSRFLNRLLGMPLDLQQLLFGYFTDTFEAVVAQAKSSGRWDEGLVSLKAESIKLVDGYPARIHTCQESGAETHVVKLELDRGVPFASALKLLRDFEADTKAHAAPGRIFTKENSFYVSTTFSNYAGTGKPVIALATEIWNSGSGRIRHFRVIKARAQHCAPRATQQRGTCRATLTPVSVCARAAEHRAPGGAQAARDHGQLQAHLGGGRAADLGLLVQPLAELLHARPALQGAPRGRRLHARHAAQRAGAHHRRRAAGVALRGEHQARRQEPAARGARRHGRRADLRGAAHREREAAEQDRGRRAGAGRGRGVRGVGGRAHGGRVGRGGPRGGGVRRCCTPGAR